MASDLHKTTVAMIHQQYSTLDIVSELQNKFDLLGDETERELTLSVNRLRREIVESRAYAEQAAEEAFRQGTTWKEVVAILEKPALLASYEVITYAHRAHEKVFGTSQK